ncbi:unnamed protein product [Lathyrus sativus]|nr:unnamed protein product [Lathyrus sativus]
MVSTLQSYNYENLNPKVETQNTPESHLLIVHIPDGFTRGDIGAKVEYDLGRVRVFGERSIGSKMMSFNEKYQVPSHCDIGNIRGKFDGKTVTITMPNIPGKVPQQEQKPIEDNNAAKTNDQKDQQNTSQQDPKSDVKSKDEDATPQDAQNATTPQKGPEEISQKDQVQKDDENPTSQDAAKESIAQKGSEEISQKESVPQKGREEISKNESVPQKDREEISQKESLPQKGQEEISQESQGTKVESKEKSHHKTSTPSTPSDETHESMPQKSQDQETPDKAVDTKDTKLQAEDTASSLKDENKENQKLVKEETTMESENLKKTMESENLQAMNDSSPTLEEETKEESKESAKVETFPQMKTYIEKGKEMINDKFGDEKKSFRESTKARIKDMASSTTQAVTNYAKRFNEEDKQKLIYTGATILVVALGVYASYKYRSSRRP